MTAPRILDALRALHAVRRRVTLTESGCWLWTGPLQSSGYGSLRWKGKMVLAHRLALEAYQVLTGRTALGARYCCHQCDVKRCANPEHQAPGTQSRNMKEWHRRRVRPPLEVAL